MTIRIRIQTQKRPFTMRMSLLRPHRVLVNSWAYMGTAVGFFDCLLTSKPTETYLELCQIVNFLMVQMTVQSHYLFRLTCAGAEAVLLRQFEQLWINRPLIPHSRSHYCWLLLVIVQSNNPRFLQ